MILQRQSWVEIKFSEISHNLQLIQNMVGKNTKIIAVVKANAYGHGAVGIARYLESRVDYFGVACLSEALELRSAKIKTPILILGYSDPKDFSEIIKHNLTATVFSYENVLELSNAAVSLHKKVRIHLKIDTGMHRIGFEPQECLNLFPKISTLPNLIIEGLFTHFSDADNPELSFTKEQLTRFKDFISKLPEEVRSISLIHAANSAATMRLPESHFNCVRIGGSLYGLKPYTRIRTDAVQHLKPVLSFKTKIIQIKSLSAGESVGYGRDFKTTEKTVIGTVSVGYADGFRRAPINFGEVLVRGKTARVVGRVGMDASHIDLTDIPEAKEGDEVTIIGKSGNQEISAEKVADRLGTINYEVVSAISKRVERIYLK